jgi:hypothetical protein
MQNQMRKTMTLALGLILAAGMAGCRVHTEKDANGKDKNVRVDTPFGSVHVNTNQTSAEDLGLPLYPGATAVKGDGDHESADVHLGFAEWEMRVRTVSYQTADPQDKVKDFYKKALGRYGDVITCQGNTPVGTPAVTSEGLTCAEDKSPKVQLNREDSLLGKENLMLKAGSKRHQHIVGFENPHGSQTRFALVALDLPTEADSNSRKSD